MKKRNYQHSEAFYQKKWEEFNNKYDEAINYQLNVRHLPVNETEKYDYEDFKEAYKSRIEAYKSDHEKGFYKYTPNAVNEMVKKFQYKLSYKEALGYWKLLKEQGNTSIVGGKSVTFISELRSMDRQQIRDAIDWSDVKHVFKSLKDAGYNNEQASHIVSQTFFGSK